MIFVQHSLTSHCCVLG